MAPNARTMTRFCLQFALKIVNFVMGLAGIGMIVYAAWMINLWYKQMHSFWVVDPYSSPPWFMYTILGMGVVVCLITFSGHVAAETTNGHCLSCYMVFTFLLVILEAAITADAFLNEHWEEDFPEDPTGRLDDLKNFVKSNFEICKWIGLVIVTSQGISIFLAMILRAVGSRSQTIYDSDDEYIPSRLPLLQHQVQQTTPYAPPIKVTVGMCDNEVIDFR